MITDLYSIYDTVRKTILQYSTCFGSLITVLLPNPRAVMLPEITDKDYVYRHNNSAKWQDFGGLRRMIIRIKVTFPYFPFYFDWCCYLICSIFPRITSQYHGNCTPSYSATLHIDECRLLIVHSHLLRLGMDELMSQLLVGQVRE